MRFQTALFLSIIFLCLGGTAGSFFSAAFAKIFHKKLLKSQLTVVCILLSIAVASGAALFVFVKDLSTELGAASSSPLYFALIFAAGFLSTVFSKIAVPLFLLLYIILSAVTGVKLYSRFGSLPDSLQVTVNSGTVNAGTKSFAVDSPLNKKIVVEVYTLPAKLVLPLPRVWYSVIGTVDSDYTLNTSEEIRLAAAFSGDEEKKLSPSESSFLWRRQLEQYEKWYLKDRVYLLVPLPEDSVLPSVYTLKFNAKGEDLRCRLEKNL